MRTILLRMLPLLLVTTITCVQASVGLDYLNNLRDKAGMPEFTSQSQLDTSAKNHSNYMQTNNVFSHGENSTKSGYTGDYASSRVIYAKYQNDSVSENISKGQASVEASIDGLMSAIYHRFGFLSLKVDEVGIGINGLYYTFDMGNSVLNDLCSNESYTGGKYYLPCADNAIKVESAAYEGRADTIKAASPDLVRWPSIGGTDIPPVFYEESPDPLPSDGVTGYPVSVEFNNASFSTAPTVNSFTLKDAVTETVVKNIVVMNADNDPNKKFSAYQSALFPKKRLEWGSVYRADFTYTYEDMNYAENWCFSTRSLKSRANRFYRVANDDKVEFQVVSGKSYAIYVVPKNTNDTLGSVTYTYSSDKADYSSIDSNTIVITIVGTIGEQATFSFGNGQEIKLTIDTTDTAKIPAAMTCSQITDTDGDGLLDSDDLDDDNDGYSDIDESRARSNSLDAKDKPLDTDRDMIPNYRDSDDDNDGISDSDELANGLNPLNASDAQADFDGDGFNNMIEISLGTDLRNNASTPIWIPIIMSDVIIFVPSAP